METTSTVVCRLDPTPEQASEIEATLKAFVEACDFIAETARAIGSTNKVNVQHVCYHEIRTRFGLSANLTLRAIAKTCVALKVSSRMRSAFAPASIDYDGRIFGFQEASWTFSLALLGGRRKIATVLGDRQRSMLKGRRPTSATLVQPRDGGYYLQVHIVDETPEPIKPEDFRGADLGIMNIATNSDGKPYSGADIQRIRKRRTVDRQP